MTATANATRSGPLPNMTVRLARDHHRLIRDLCAALRERPELVDQVTGIVAGETVATEPDPLDYDLSARLRDDEQFAVELSHALDEAGFVVESVEKLEAQRAEIADLKRDLDQALAAVENLTRDLAEARNELAERGRSLTEARAALDRASNVAPGLPDDAKRQAIADLLEDQVNPPPPNEFPKYVNGRICQNRREERASLAHGPAPVPAEPKSDWQKMAESVDFSERRMRG